MPKARGARGLALPSDDFGASTNDARRDKTGERRRMNELPSVFARCACRAVRPLSFDDGDGRTRRSPIDDRGVVLRLSAAVLDQWLGHPRLLPTVLPAWLALRLRRFWSLAGQRTVNAPRAVDADDYRPSFLARRLLSDAQASPRCPRTCADAMESAHRDIAEWHRRPYCLPFMRSAHVVGRAKGP